jgi:hypothetical protein
MCLALLARECLLADWHRLHMLAMEAPHLRGSRVGLFRGLGGVVGTVRDAVTPLELGALAPKSPKPIDGERQQSEPWRLEHPAGESSR